MKSPLLATLVGLCLSATATFGDIELLEYSTAGYVPIVTADSPFQFLSPASDSEFVALSSDDGLVLSEPAPANERGTSNIASAPIKVLNYPNPFSFRSGTTIGYQLYQAMAIELKLYTLTGYPIYSAQFGPNEEGGLAQYNHIPINPASLNGVHLVPGVYLYGIFSDGKLLAKSRMVVTP